MRDARRSLNARRYGPRKRNHTPRTTRTPVVTVEIWTTRSETSSASTTFSETQRVDHLDNRQKSLQYEQGQYQSADDPVPEQFLGTVEERVCGPRVIFDSIPPVGGVCECRPALIESTRSVRLRSSTPSSHAEGVVVLDLVELTESEVRERSRPDGEPMTIIHSAPNHHLARGKIEDERRRRT